ncbi:hypothetical protein [Seonamhaeicola marinus]|uniref:Uncharacterized protein n=1 Tax=Seonamhaeicola marinus TaxID=1912246 RepID=A0A5D0HTQ0_9FLAO|nr:hypothetical protein [Seonamhaeicola marinus]TYA74734.1 hypothetical protein FUA24_15600 [Seonamhaeicola marinus]
MGYKLIFILFLSVSIYAQDSIETKLIKSTDFKADRIVSVDNFGTTYYIQNNTFYKKTSSSSLSYNNFQLGDLTTVNTFNPLKINLFYQDFNTAIILDNRLAEIFKIDFNAVIPYKNITHISTGFDNTIWIFNQDSQQLELYNYKTNKTQARSLPISSKILDLKSNYNNVWLLTEEYLYQYNYFGNLLNKTANNGYTKMVENNNTVVLKKGTDLYMFRTDNQTVTPILLPNLLTNAFFVTNETLYIYHDQTLQEFQLKTN